MALPYLQPGSTSWLPISDAPERVGQSDDVLAKDRLAASTFANPSFFMVAGAGYAEYYTAHETHWIDLK